MPIVPHPKKSRAQREAEDAAARLHFFEAEAQNLNVMHVEKTGASANRQIIFLPRVKSQVVLTLQEELRHYSAASIHTLRAIQKIRPVTGRSKCGEKTAKPRTVPDLKRGRGAVTVKPEPNLMKALSTLKKG